MSINDGLVLALNFDQAGQMALRDAAGNIYQPTLKGATIVPDEKFGTALSFDGNNQALEVTDHPAFNITGDLTLAVWVYLAAPMPSWTRIIGKGTEGAGNETYGLWVLQSANFWWFQQLGTNPPLQMNTTAHPIDPNTWYHLTAVRQGDIATLYLDGLQQIAQQTGATGAPNMNVAPLIIGYNGEYAAFNGRIAHLRLYNRALTETDRVAVLADSGVGVLFPPAIKPPAPAPPAAAFRRSHPIDFNLFDADHHYALYINDDPTGQQLTLEVQNTSAQTLQFSPGQDQIASAQNYHFELRFRPGTLSTNSLTMFRDSQARQQVLPDAEDWDLYVPPASDAAEHVSLYLLYKGASTQWPPAERRSLILQHLSAAPAGGARGTRVELSPHQLAFADDATPLSGSRTRHLSIVNHRGQKHIPLHVGFVGPNRVLNDGSAHEFNTLHLRITNTAPQDGAVLDLSNQAKLILSVETGGLDKEWALTTPDAAKAIQVTVKRGNNWEEVPEASGNQALSPEWIIEGSLLPAPRLAPGEHFEIKLANLATLHPTGPANLYLGYENIPGYWDGQFVATIEKTPLLFLDQHVGIGTPAPSAQLHVVGAGLIGEGNNYANSSGYMAAGSLTIGSTTMNYGGGTNWNSNTAGLLLETTANTEIAVHDSYTRLASLLYYEGDAANQITIGRDMGWGTINTLALNGKVGIGTETPAAQLHVVGAGLIGEGNNYANSSGYMAAGSLTIGSTTMNYGGGTNWNSNTAGLLLETTANTEIAVHDSYTRLASLLYYEGDAANQITIGRDMGWGRTNVKVAGDLRVEGNIYKKANDWWYLELNEPPPGPRNQPLIISVGTNWRRGSDGRLKQGIRQIDQALAKIANLRGITFEWNELGLRHLTREIERRIVAGPEATAEENQRVQEAARQEAYQLLAGPQVGLVAQDVEQVLPELVDADDAGYKTLRYDLLTALLVEAVKELSERVERMFERLGYEEGTV